MKIERFECQLYSKLIWLLLNWRIFKWMGNEIYKRKGYSAVSGSFTNMQPGLLKGSAGDTFPGSSLDQQVVITGLYIGCPFGTVIMIFIWIPRLKPEVSKSILTNGTLRFFFDIYLD